MESVGPVIYGWSVRNETAYFSNSKNMKQPLLALALLAILPVSAQWDLFPLGQRSYFNNLDLDEVLVDMVRMDSLWDAPDGSVHLYNKRQLRRSLIGPCGGQSLEHLVGQSFFNGWLDLKLMGDSLVQRNDTVFYERASSDTPFFFLPHAAVGQSWTVSSTWAGNTFTDITITCTALAEDTFLGVTDSVKTFSLQAVGAASPINAERFVLSKEHGLVEFVPFMYFLEHPQGQAIPAYRLMGLEKDGTTHGYRQPDFSDHFHLSPGDVVLWEYHNVPGWITQQEYYEYRRDSVTAAVITPDSVVYTYFQTYTHADHSVTTHPVVLDRYHRASYEGLVGGAPNDLFLEVGGFGASPTVWGKSTMAVTVGQGGQEITATMASSAGGLLVEETCIAEDGADLGQDIQLDTRIGLVRTVTWINPAVITNTVVAYRINGEEFGDLTLGLGELHMPMEPLVVSPNPALDHLVVQGAGPGASYLVHDLLGRELQRGALPAGGIPVDALPGGAYILRVTSGTSVRSAHFVKQ